VEESTAGGVASQVVEIVADRLPALVEDGSSSPVCVLGGRAGGWFDGVGAGGCGGRWDFVYRELVAAAL